MEQSYEGYKEEPTGSDSKPLPKEVPSAEYRLALDRLKSFAEADVQKIATLQHLSEKAGGAGQDLRKLIASNGTIELIEQRHGLWPMYIYRVDTGNAALQFMIDADHTVVYKSEDKTQIENRTNGFVLQIPSDRLLDADKDTFGGHLSTYAASYRGESKVFSPLRHPHDSQVQQGFASLLQEAVRDILPVITLPQRRV